MGKSFQKILGLALFIFIASCGGSDSLDQVTTTTPPTTPISGPTSSTQSGDNDGFGFVAETASSNNFVLTSTTSEDDSLTSSNFSVEIK